MSKAAHVLRRTSSGIIIAVIVLAIIAVGAVEEDNPPTALTLTKYPALENVPGFQSVESATQDTNPRKRFARKHNLP